MFILYTFLAAPHSGWDFSSLTKGWTHILALQAWSLTHWTAREVPHMADVYIVFSICRVCLHFCLISFLPYNYFNKKHAKPTNKKKKKKTPFFPEKEIFPHSNLMFWSSGPEDKLCSFNPKFWSLLVLWSCKIYLNCLVGFFWGISEFIIL